MRRQKIAKLSFVDQNEKKRYTKEEKSIEAYL